MTLELIDNYDLANTCASTQVQKSHGLLLQKLNRLYPELSFVRVLSRGGWYRNAGIIDSKGNRIADNLLDWLDNEGTDDIDKLFEQYADMKYIATVFRGKTHYFVAQTGDLPGDFFQLEVEELQEVQDHLLFDTESLVEDIDDIIDPVDVEKLSPEAVAEPRYVFRRIAFINDYVLKMAEKSSEKNKSGLSIKRFMDDWQRSSSYETKPFCHCWVLALQQHTDAWGEPIMQAKPVSTFLDETPVMELKADHRGSKLARLIHGFDHQIGYPMAWYFFMLSHTEVSYQLAENIHNDLMGAYDYLPARDMKILKDWTAKPYSI